MFAYHQAFYSNGRQVHFTVVKNLKQFFVLFYAL